MSSTPVNRGRVQGLTQIVQFNWPFYVCASITCVAAVAIASYAPLPQLAKNAIDLGAAAALFWIVSSLIVSYWVYDLSALCKWRWIDQVLAVPPKRWLNLHCGFDESTPALRAMFAGSEGRTLDIFDATEMNEASILRARALADSSSVSESADYRHLPADDGSQDAVFLLLAAHELRQPASRVRLLGEVARVLRPEGRAVLVEHVRDPANFVAFGPGFLHFHSLHTWRAAIRESGMTSLREFRITPFVVVFVLGRPT